MWGTLVALVAVSLAGVIGWRRPREAPYVSAAAALLSAIALSLAWAAGDPHIASFAWMTPVGSHFTLALDPLAAPLAVFVTAIAAPILLYSAGYPIPDRARFCAWMLVFLAAMVLLFVARDLLVVFAAFELSALASFLLIQLDRQDPAARRAAMLTLAVTVGSSLVFLAGVLWIAAEVGSTGIAEAAARPLPPGALACLIVGALGKSAQVPLHFWLPRAMVAPTPVSAYLHSAALVAAGVFVLMRIRALLASSPSLLEAILALGLLSIFTGGALALVRDGLKEVLAYSTIAQYGYALVLIGLGGSAGLAGAPLFLVAHGVCKSALFLMAGAVTTVTGAKKLSETGGLARRMPLLAISSGVAAAGLAGLPLTVGYFKDEVLFAAAYERGAPMLLVTAIAAAMTVAYSARLWAGVFLGRSRGPRVSAPLLVWPVALLAAVTIALGLARQPLERVFTAAGHAVAGHPISFELHPLLEPRPETFAALGAWLAGLTLFSTRRSWEAPLRHLTARLSGPARLFGELARAARWSSDALHHLEVRDLRDRVGAVLVPTAVLVGLAYVAGRGPPDPRGALGGHDLLLSAALAVMALAAIVAARPRRHFSIVLQLSFVGFSLALIFAFAGAAEVALVIVLVETLFTLLFLGVLLRIRPGVLKRTVSRPERGRDAVWIAAVAGASAFLVAWTALATPTYEGLPAAYVRLAERAHAGDAITAVLADFRGLDTAVELTVLAVAVLGAVAVARGGRA